MLSQICLQRKRGIGDVSLNEFFDCCEEAKTTLTATVEIGAESGSIPATPLDILISLSDDDGERRSSPFVSPEGFLSKRMLNRLLPFSAQMKMLQRKAQVEPVYFFYFMSVGN